MMPENIAHNVTVSLCAKVLQSIFDECDRYDHDETGGRILGVCRRTSDGSLHIDVSGVIEPGPKARRSSSSFFQDGDYQAQVFRQLEKVHPEIEHLGNWHTHHVNGVPTLSGGDVATYQRIVNHEQHNLDFFYALLVVAREPGRESLERYRTRHYILFRGDQNIYEIAPDDIVITNEPTIWPIEHEAEATTVKPPSDVTVRAKDKEIIGEIYPEFQPYLSERTRTFYWKGRYRLIDDSIVQVMIPEMTDALPDAALYYQVIVKNAPSLCLDIVEQLAERRFVSASQAIRAFELQLNQTLYYALESGGS